MTTDSILAKLKSIDLAEIEIIKLSANSQNCEPITPEVAVLSLKYLGQALYEKDITEKEYNEKIKILNRETDRFKNNCSCLIKTIAGKYD